MPDWLWILLGFTTLVVGGDLLVRGSAWLALALGIRPMVVGLTVVAFGTSAPELAASVAAVLEQRGDTAIGTVFGSNIANIALIVGVAALVWPIHHVPGSARFEVRCLLGVSMLAPVALLWDRIERWHGVVLLLGLVLFTLTLLRRELRSRGARAAAAELGGVVVPAKPSAGSYLLHIGLVLLGLVGLKYGADWLLHGAIRVASQFGISDAVVGAVLIAIGTSLPELAASIAAAKRRHPEIALGNVLGSNLFNVGMVLGTTASITPLSLPSTFQGFVVANFLLTGVLAYLLAFRGGVSRTAGVGLLGCYAVYLAWAIANRAA